jgi:hypothetical protein
MKCLVSYSGVFSIEEVRSRMSQIWMVKVKLLNCKVR